VRNQTPVDLVGYGVRDYIRRGGPVAGPCKPVTSYRVDTQEAQTWIANAIRFGGGSLYARSLGGRALARPLAILRGRTSGYAGSSRSAPSR
jgi:hypothetical protein